jgi:hypothetical protein
MVDPSIEAARNADRAALDGLGSEAPLAPQADDLDQLLADFDASFDASISRTPDPTPSSPELQALARAPQQEHQYAPQNSENEALLNRVNQIEVAHAVEKAGRDLAALTNEVRGDLDPHMFTQDFITNWVDSRARQNVALQGVWLRREQEPESYRAAVKMLTKEFHRTFKAAPDPQATADREAVVAAVLRAGASSSRPEEPPVRYGRLSNAEFRADIREKFGYDPL